MPGTGFLARSLTLLSIISNKVILNRFSYVKFELIVLQPYLQLYQLVAVTQSIFFKVLYQKQLTAINSNILMFPGLCLGMADSSHYIKCDIRCHIIKKYITFTLNYLLPAVEIIITNDRKHSVCKYYFVILPPALLPYSCCVPADSDDNNF